MREEAEQMLVELRRQEANFDEQLKMTRGAIQAIEHLLHLMNDDDSQEKAEA